MKVTRFTNLRPVQTLSTLGGGGGEIGPGSPLPAGFPPSGQIPVANGSNTWAWGSNIATIWSNGSNQIMGPDVNFLSGAGIAFAAASNTLTIINTGQGGGGGGGTGALTHLSTTTLGADAADITVTGISALYKDLIVVFTGRSATASTKAITMRVGSGSIDTGSNYSILREYAGTLGSGSTSSASTTGWECGSIPGSGATSGYFGSGRWEIIDYASTSKSRIMVGEAFSQGDDGTLRGNIYGMWQNVSAGIDQVRIFASSGNLLAGTKINLYGRG